MNGEYVRSLEGAVLVYLKVLLWQSCVKAEESHRNVLTTGIRARVRPKNLLNTRLQCYHYSNLLGPACWIVLIGPCVTAMMWVYFLLLTWIFVSQQLPLYTAFNPLMTINQSVIHHAMCKITTPTSLKCSFFSLRN